MYESVCDNCDPVCKGGVLIALASLTHVMHTELLGGLLQNCELAHSHTSILT